MVTSATRWKQIERAIDAVISHCRFCGMNGNCRSGNYSCEFKRMKVMVGSINEADKVERL
jgi:hypothetical protein